MKNIDIENVCWHDGNLISFEYNTTDQGSHNFTLIADIYENINDIERTRYAIKCIDTERIFQNLSSFELQENYSAGNISNGYIKDKTLWLYLCDGIIEIIAKAYELKKC